MPSSDLAPAFLVALDTIVDPNFRRTVIFMLNHDEEGAFGLVLNRKSDFSMEDLCENLDLAWKGDPGVTVDWGGPVQPELGWVVLGDTRVDALEVEAITDGVRFSRSRAVLEQIADNPDARARVFLGYAGWAAGQLESELAQGSWLVVPFSESLLFDVDEDSLWERAVRSLGVEPATLVATQGVN